MSLLFTLQELDALAACPKDRMERALANGSLLEAAEVFSDLEKNFRKVIRGFSVWAGVVQAWLQNRAAQPDSAGGLDVESAWLIGHVNGVTATDLECMTPVTFPIVEGRSAAEAGMGFFLSRLESFRRVHDAHRDWTSALLSQAYRATDADGLEQCLRVLGRKTLLRWMPDDVLQDPRERLASWSALLHANFATIRIEETDDMFTIVQDPCGTCTRQIDDGAYRPPINLAVVRENHPVTYGRGDLPIYRCHVAVIHHFMAIEQTGTPWPIHHCPEHLGTTPCRIDLVKTPAALVGQHGM